MPLAFSAAKPLLTATLREVSDDDVPSLAAAIAYYTVFSLPPLLVILVGVAGAVLGPERIVEALTGRVSGAVGPDAADAVRTMIDNARSVGSGVGATLLGIGALVFGATGAFGQLRKALNRAWDVDPEATTGGLGAVVVQRVLAFGMVLVVAAFLLLSMVLSTVLASVGGAVEAALGGGALSRGVRLANEVVSLGVTAGLFAVLFKTLPDAAIAWRDVAVGAVVTAVLFALGKAGLTVYFTVSDPGSAFGAAGALALLMVWIYYSALILLVGAEFTQVWARRVGAGLDAPASSPEVHPVARPRDPAPY